MTVEVQRPMHGLKAFPGAATTKLWPLYEKAIKGTLGGELAEDELERTAYELQRALLSGHMTGWLAWQQPEDLEKPRIVKAVMLTEVQTDLYTHQKHLLVYLLYGTAPLTDEEWYDGLQTLRSFAALKGCVDVISYTESFRIINQAERVGGEAKRRVLRIPVGD